MIKTQLIGRLGKDAEVKEFNGKKVINFNVAIDTGYGENKKTMWVNCSKWGEKTGIADYLKKGTQVFVDGEPSLREWESNGKSGTSFEMRVNEIVLVGSKQDGAQLSTEQQPIQPAANTSTVKDDLPF